MVLASLVGYRVDLCVCVVGWPTICFYYIELHNQEYISETETWPLVKTIPLLVLFPLVVVLMVIYCVALPY